MNRFVKILLIPASYLYGAVTFIRNLLYDIGILRSVAFTETAVIAVGNLSVGGTGKSPHIEYLIRLLTKHYSVATLSRGYGRETSGFMEVATTSTSFEAGDEPCQFKRKFPAIRVAVDGNRVRGIRQLMLDGNKPQVVLLDDAFQHRAVKTEMSILLTDYTLPYYNDMMLPSGTLREFSAGADRANIIIVTKCPENITAIEKRSIINHINPKPYQKIFFSHIQYGQLLPVYENNNVPIVDKQTHVFLLTGIANHKPLENYIKPLVKKIEPFNYGDHHEFSIVEMIQLKEQFERCTSENKIIITTEKDAMRLKKEALHELLNTLPVFFMPMQIYFNTTDQTAFEQTILQYVKEYTSNSRLSKA